MPSLLSLPVLVDFGIISTLILLAHLLRNRIKLLQNAYIPSSIIAGLLGLLGGPQFLDILAFSKSSSGQQNIASYPAFLVVLLFATLFLGNRKKKLTVKNAIQHAGDTFFFNLASILGQYGFAILFGLLFLYPLFSYLPQGFYLILPVGFVGGHGTATAVGSVLESYGMDGALSLAYASATVGILVGIFGGMILINLATRLGWTRLVKAASKMPMSMRSGFVDEAEQSYIGKETTSPMALDPLTWHLILVFIASYFAHLSAFFIDKHLHISIPVFCLALLLGALLQKTMNMIKLGKYIDRHIIHRIGSMVTDFLVAFGVASISVKVVFTYALPLIMIFAFGTIFTLMLMWWVGRRICRNFWFERSMLMYGWNTGSVATSMLLVRILDPDMTTGILEDFGVSYFGIAFVEIAIISTLPHLIMKGIVVLPMLVLLGAFFACILLSRALVGWFTKSPTKLRHGEIELMRS